MLKLLHWGSWCWLPFAIKLSPIFLSLYLCCCTSGYFVSLSNSLPPPHGVVTAAEESPVLLVTTFPPYTNKPFSPTHIPHTHVPYSYRVYHPTWWWSPSHTIQFVQMLKKSLLFLSKANLPSYNLDVWGIYVFQMYSCNLQSILFRFPFVFSST